MAHVSQMLWMPDCEVLRSEDPSAPVAAAAIVAAAAFRRLHQFGAVGTWLSRCEDMRVSETKDPVAAAKFRFKRYSISITTSQPLRVLAASGIKLNCMCRPSTVRHTSILQTIAATAAVCEEQLRPCSPREREFFISVHPDADAGFWWIKPMDHQKRAGDGAYRVITAFVFEDSTFNLWAVKYTLNRASYSSESSSVVNAISVLPVPDHAAVSDHVHATGRCSALQCWLPQGVLADRPLACNNPVPAVHTDKTDRAVVQQLVHDACEPLPKLVAPSHDQLPELITWPVSAIEACCTLDVLPKCSECRRASAIMIALVHKIDLQKVPGGSRVGLSLCETLVTWKHSMCVTNTGNHAFILSYVCCTCWQHMTRISARCAVCGDKSGNDSEHPRMEVQVQQATYLLQHGSRSSVHDTFGMYCGVNAAEVHAAASLVAVRSVASDLRKWCTQVPCSKCSVVPVGGFLYWMYHHCHAEYTEPPLDCLVCGACLSKRRHAPCTSVRECQLSGIEHMRVELNLCKGTKMLRIALKNARATGRKYTTDSLGVFLGRAVSSAPEAQPCASCTVQAKFAVMHGDCLVMALCEDHMKQKIESLTDACGECEELFATHNRVPIPEQ